PPHEGRGRAPCPDGPAQLTAGAPGPTPLDLSTVTEQEPPVRREARPRIVEGTRGVCGCIAEPPPLLGTLDQRQDASNRLVVVRDDPFRRIDAARTVGSSREVGPIAHKWCRAGSGTLKEGGVEAFSHRRRD